VSGTTFTWANSDPTIGLAASGTGNIASFSASNNTSAAIVATVTVTPYANGCDGTPKTFTFTINPKPTADPITSQSVCAGTATTAVTFTGNVSGSTYTWTNSTSSIGLGATGNGNIAAFNAANSTINQVVATVTYIPHASGCNGTSYTFTYSVTPAPVVNTIPNQTFCNGANTPIISFSGTVSGTTYAWTNSNTAIGLAASGDGNLPVFTAVNTSSNPLTATITVTPSANNCTGLPKTFTITINPTTAVNPISNQSICGGNLSSQVNFTATIGSSTFSWVNSNPSIGIAASGNGNIAPFTTINNGTTTITDTCYVTPSYGSCPGTTVPFVYTVIPQANVNTITNQSYCHGVTAGPFVFSGTVPGTTYSWTNSNPAIGLAASGTGNIPTFTATNTAMSAITATINVTPKANNCDGQVMTFTITVTPTPAMGLFNSQTVCNGTMIPAIIFTGLTNGTTFSWTNNLPGIGVPATGTGTIPAFTATNSSDTIQVATITVTPHVNTCTGNNVVFTITIKPSPHADTVQNDTVCKGSLTNLISLTGGVVNTVFNWSNSMTFIGLPAYGMDNIYPFVAQNNTNAPMTGVITVTPVANGCVGPNMEFSITVIPIPTAEAGANIVVCYGDTAQLSGTGGGTYAWSPPIGLSDTTVSDPKVYPEITTIYHLTVSVNGCTASDSVKVTVNLKPIVDAGAPKTICIGDSVKLLATGGDMYLWSNGATIDSTMVSPLVNTMYYVTVTNESGCWNIDSVGVSVNPLPVLSVSPSNPYICADSTIDLFATGAAAYTWSPINGLLSPYGPSVKASPILNTTYTVTGISYNGCISTESVEVRVLPTPIVQLADTGFVCMGDEFMLSGGYNDSTTCIWSTGETSNNISVSEPGLYWIAVSNKGCTVYDTTYIFTCTDIWIPSAFAPNPNGINDYFIAKASTELKDFSMTIYDRWGRLMFKSQDINEGWDGTNKGQNCPSGVYTYIVSWEGVGYDSHLRRNLKKGSLMLLR
jgi:gliding motility-associated-like protein